MNKIQQIMNKLIGDVYESGYRCGYQDGSSDTKQIETEDRRVEEKEKRLRSPQDIVDLLNEMLKLDSTATLNLVDNKVMCNEKLAKHPTLQIDNYASSDNYMVGLIGVINGLFGVNEYEYGTIAAVYEGSKLVKFIYKEDLGKPANKDNIVKY
jgi:hypothetical protein